MIGHVTLFLNCMYKRFFDMVLLCTFIATDTFFHIKCAVHVLPATFTSVIPASTFNNMQQIDCCKVFYQCKGCSWVSTISS